MVTTTHATPDAHIRVPELAHVTDFDNPTVLHLVQGQILRYDLWPALCGARPADESSWRTVSLDEVSSAGIHFPGMRSCEACYGYLSPVQNLELALLETNTQPLNEHYREWTYSVDVTVRTTVTLRCNPVDTNGGDWAIDTALANKLQVEGLPTKNVEIRRVVSREVID